MEWTTRLKVGQMMSLKVESHLLIIPQSEAAFGAP